MKATDRFVIRAYCGTCHKLLLESNPTSKKQLKSYWDDAVMSAPLCIFCKDCHPKQTVNFDLEFKIYDRLKELEHPVSFYFKSKIDPESYSKITKRKDLEDSIQASGELSQKEKFDLTLKMRQQFSK